MLRGPPDSVICQDQTTFSYLQMHLNAENSLALCGQNVFVKIFVGTNIAKKIRPRFVPGETDTNPSRTGAATSATLLGLPGDRIKEARKWHCDLI